MRAAGPILTDPQKTTGGIKINVLKACVMACSQYMKRTEKNRTPVPNMWRLPMGVFTAHKLGPDLQNILRQSYDNAIVTIDLQRITKLQNILRRMQGLSWVRLTCKIVRSSEIVFVH